MVHPRRGTKLDPRSLTRKRSQRTARSQYLSSARPVDGRGRLMGEGSYARRPIDAANAPGTCIMTPTRPSANNGVPLASWRPRRSLPNPTLE